MNLLGTPAHRAKFPGPLLPVEEARSRDKQLIALPSSCGNSWFAVLRTIYAYSLFKLNWILIIVSATHREISLGRSCKF